MPDATALLDAPAVMAWLTGVVGPRLDAAAADLRQRFPGLDIQATAQASGGHTAYETHAIAIDVRLPGESVALAIKAAYLSSTPRVYGDVCWGGGTIEASTCDDWRSSRDWPRATAAALGDVEAALVRLTDALAEAITRGSPSA